MYWQLNDNKITVPTVPLYICGTTKDHELMLVTETGDSLANAYLALLDPTTQGILQAKIGSGAFEEIGLLGQGSCWIGDILDGESVVITFRIALALAFPDGLYLPTVLVIAGDAGAAPVPFWTDDIDSPFTDTITDFFV
jgi:hypothetical protein